MIKQWNFSYIFLQSKNIKKYDPANSLVPLLKVCPSFRLLNSNLLHTLRIIRILKKVFLIAPFTFKIIKNKS